MTIKKRSAPLRSADGWTSKAFGTDGIDVGYYAEAKKAGTTMSMLLEQIKSEKEGAMSPYFGMTKWEVLQAKKSMRAAGKVAPLTAFEEALQIGGIKVSGSYSDRLGKFYEHSDVDVLFPEFIADRVYAGLLNSSLVREFIMGETVIDSTTFQKLYMEDDQDDRQLKNVGKMGELPETRIEVGDQTVRLDKYGRYLKMPMEDLKFQRINIFARFLERIGAQLGVDQTDLMFYRLINGDGNTGSTPQTTTTAAASGAGELSLNDAINWAIGLPTPYKMDKFVMRKANLVKYYGRLYDATTTSIAGSDRLVIFPQAFEWDRTVITSNYAWGVDSRYAVEMVTTGGVQTDYEKIVRQTAQGTAIYCFYEFPIADGNAVQKWDLSS